MAGQRAGSPRRGLLKRGLLLAAGAAGLSLGGGRAEARASRADSIFTEAVVFRGRHWHLLSQDLPRGVLPERGDRVALYGELLDAAGERKVGEFYSACFVMNSPFGVGPHAAASLQLHTLNLDDGTITGMGTGQGDGDVYAIVGGTGRYLGARGSYTTRYNLIEWGGDGTAELRLTLVL